MSSTEHAHSVRPGPNGFHPPAWFVRPTHQPSSVTVFRTVRGVGAQANFLDSFTRPPIPAVSEPDADALELQELELIRAADAAEEREQAQLRETLDGAYAAERAVWDFLPNE